jgi:hypothetical protein
LENNASALKGSDRGEYQVVERNEDVSTMVLFDNVENFFLESDNRIKIFHIFAKNYQE